VARRVFFGGGAVSVTRNSDKVEGGIERNLTRKIAQKNGRAFENADKDNRLAAKIARNLFSQLGDSLGNGFA
jgi:hypothetical protein